MDHVIWEDEGTRGQGGWGQIGEGHLFLASLSLSSAFRDTAIEGRGEEQYPIEVDHANYR